MTWSFAVEDPALALVDIDASNVRPAFEASLVYGVTEAELQTRLGWTRAELERDGATVSGASTYAHMEWMAERPDFPAFVLTAVQAHTAASLGVVGLACKTEATVADALHCHQRFQHLTNRTAAYASAVEGDTLVIRETRFGDDTRGSRLVSDYTLLVAVHLLRALLGTEVPLRRVRCRQHTLSQPARESWEAFATAPLEAGAPQAELVFDVGFAAQSVPAADPELSRYFAAVLAQAAPAPVAEPTLEQQVRAEVAARLQHGSPSATEVARALGLGSRTLSRRLAEHDQTFGGLLESVRRTQAKRYLGDPSLRLAEVAYLLGYAEHASFYRAFRRWFGVTPSQYRASGGSTGGGEPRIEG